MLHHSAIVKQTPLSKSKDGKTGNVGGRDFINDLECSEYLVVGLHGTALGVGHIEK